MITPLQVQNDLAGLIDEKELNHLSAVKQTSVSAQNQPVDKFNTFRQPDFGQAIMAKAFELNPDGGMFDVEMNGLTPLKITSNDGGGDDSDLCSP